MKQLLLSVLLFSMYSFNAFAAIKIDSSQKQVSASEKIKYSFQLQDDKTLAQLTDKNLIETHTKILHLVVYDASLNEFNHVHPEFDGSSWNVELSLPVNGSYMVWAQGETTSGKEFSTYRPLLVENGEPEIAVTSLGDVRVGVDGVTQVELANTKIKAGKMVMIDFTVTRTDGTTPSLSPYLGAFAHVIATALNGSELIHVHPMEGDDANSGMLHATFPAAGEYRLWVQFNDNNELKTIPLSVVVK
ncbi:MAG: hypothetical protein K2Q26_12195 [Bdellovibrionales bacterium]|nr:hypothetical protein [Bdellovibrionales bacterium]